MASDYLSKDFSFDAGPILRVNIVEVNQVPNIVSGGQTGADRAVLDWAIQNGIWHSGWCPKGRRAEDGPIDPKYQLRETPSPEYDQRTEWNVRDSDGTVVFSVGEGLTGGSNLTVELAQKHGKPVLHLSRTGGPASPELALRRFIQDHGIKVLNVAGPRASKEPRMNKQNSERRSVSQFPKAENTQFASRKGLSAGHGNVKRTLQRC